MPRDQLRYGSFAATALLLAAAVDGVLAYPQMLLFGGTVVLPTVSVKIALLLVCLTGAAWLLVSKHRQDVASTSAAPQRASVGAGRVKLLASVLLVYLGIHATVFSQHPLLYTARGFNAYYFYLLLAPLLVMSGFRVRPKTVVITVLVSALPLLVLGFLQSALGAPLLPVTASDVSFETHAWKFYGAVRAFSLFSSPASFGAFLVFAALLCLALVRDTSSTGVFTHPRALRIVLLVLFALVLAGLLVTRTRAVWLHAAFSIATLLLWPRITRMPRLLSLLPVVAGVVVLAGIAAFLAAGGTSMAAAESLLQRFDGWWYAVSRWMSGDVGTALFGTGFFQHGTANGTGDLLIDSTFIGAGLQIGIVGLALLVLLQTAMWRALATAAARRSPLAIAAAAYCAPWTLLWLQGIAVVPFAIVFLLAILGGVVDQDTDTPGSVSLFTPGSERVLYLASLAFAALVVYGALHTPAAQSGGERWESRVRMKLLQAAQHRHHAWYGRWCDGVDSLVSFAGRADTGLDDAAAYLPLYGRAVPVDSIGRTPGSGRSYVVITTPDGARYQIRDPDGHGYIGSWTVPEEFDRASWR